jgi:hypothetical protein
VARADLIRRPEPERVAHIVCEEAELTAEGGFAVKGWAVASSSVADIRIELDGETIGVTTPVESRPDVANRYPRVETARTAGFRLRRALGTRFDGDHVVRLTVRGRDGEQASCRSPPRPITIFASNSPPSPTPAVCHRNAFSYR